MPSSQAIQRTRSRFARSARRAYTLVVVAFAAIPANAQLTPESATGSDEGLPLWEFGVGGALVSTPDYPAASGSTVRGAPLPVVIYRGKFLRVGDGSLAAGRLFESDRLELDLSVNGSFDANSDDVAVRNGMPDLGWAFEVGPELEWLIFAPETERRRLKLELPLRAAFSADDGRLNPRGFVFSPQLEYEHEFADGRYELSFTLTPSIATRKLHDYFFTVDPQFETANRRQYQARGGYLQTSLGVGLQRRGEKSFAAIGISYVSFSGGANQDSPLFVRDDGWRLGVFFVRRLWQSERRVKRPVPDLTESEPQSTIDTDDTASDTP
ncbi:MAG: MipA/OmpV family protein [Pseudomonadota bacterium]